MASPSPCRAHQRKELMLSHQWMVSYQSLCIKGCCAWIFWSYSLSEARREMNKNRHPCQMMISTETIAPIWWDKRNHPLTIQESACNAGDLGLVPGLGRFPWRREKLHTPVFWPGEFHGLYTVHVVTKSWTRLSDLHTHTYHSPQWLYQFTFTQRV